MNYNIDGIQIVNTSLKQKGDDECSQSNSVYISSLNVLLNENVTASPIYNFIDSGHKKINNDMTIPLKKEVEDNNASSHNCHSSRKVHDNYIIL